MKLEEGYIIYQPQEPEALLFEHWEVWIGLPPKLVFEEVPARNPKLIGLRAKTANNHVWVMPEVVADLKENPLMRLAAIGNRTARGGMSFDVFLPGRPDIVAFAVTINAEKLYRREGEKRAKGKKSLAATSKAKSKK